VPTLNPASSPSRIAKKAYFMKFSTLVLGALGVLPALSSGITVSDAMQRSLAAYANYAKRDIVSTILNDIEQATTCAACEVSIRSPY
jgi:hypothetical protein